jgi:hypothetical protein
MSELGTTNLDDLPFFVHNAHAAAADLADDLEIAEAAVAFRVSGLVHGTNQATLSVCPSSP